MSQQHRNDKRRNMIIKVMILSIFGIISLLPDKIHGKFYGKFRENPSVGVPKHQMGVGIDRSYFDASIDGKGNNCNKQCQSTSQCCNGYTCVKAIRNAFAQGVCVASQKDKEGMPCVNDEECFPYECTEMKTVFPTLRFCQKPQMPPIGNSIESPPYNSIGIEKKHFNDHCRLSSNCEESKGLCCSRIRIHRQQESFRCRYKENVKCVEEEESENGDVEDNQIYSNSLVSNDDASDSRHSGGGGGFRGKDGGGMSPFFHMKLKPYFF